MLGMALDYWEPSGGLIPPQEMRGIKGLANYFEQSNGRPGQLSEAVAAYIAAIEADRADRFPITHKDAEEFRRWALIEAGFFDLVQTPSGIVKKARSMKFSKMEGEEFGRLYASVFAVLWRVILSAHFENEGQAQAAADNFGNFA